MFRQLIDTAKLTVSNAALKFAGRAGVGIAALIAVIFLLMAITAWLIERLVLGRERLSRIAIERYRVRHGLSAQEVRRLERLPLSQRLLAMRELDRAGQAGAPR